MAASAVPVLMYHHVSPAPGLVTVSPETFCAQMRWLAEHGYCGITCEDFAAFLAGAPIPDKSVLISFDDGYLDNWVYAAPVLAEFGLHAALFLITGRIGEGPARPQAPARESPPCLDHRGCMERIAQGDADSVMLRWSEVDAMAKQGVFEFHSHTHTHIRWDREETDPENRRRRLVEDLAASRAALAQHLGQAAPHLCWPQGYYDGDYLAAARQAGFTHLYTVEKGTATRDTNPRRIPRIVVKDRAGSWFARRMWLYRHPRLARSYLRLRGE